MAIVHKILTKDGIKEKTLTPIKAIRAKCMQCSNWQHSEAIEDTTPEIIKEE